METTLHNQRFLVHLADGSTLEAEARNPDYLRWEMTANRERWPMVETNAQGEPTVRAPMLMTTFLAWASLNRTGEYAGKWKEFSEDDCVGVTPLEDVPVDPTQPVADTGS